MVRIRLGRYGRKKRPFYRIVVSDSRAPRDSGFIEKIGFYNPLPKSPIIEVDADKALEWLEKGAQPTDTVKNLFSKKGIMLMFDMRKKKAPVDQQIAALNAWKAKHPEWFVTATEPAEA